MWLENGWLWEWWHCQHSKGPRYAARELNESEIINTKEESGCDKKDKDVSETVKVPVNLTLKDMSEIFQKTESENCPVGRILKIVSRFLSPGYSIKQYSKYSLLWRYFTEVIKVPSRLIGGYGDLGLDLTQFKTLKTVFSIWKWKGREIWRLFSF